MENLEIVDLATRPDLQGLSDSVIGSAWRHLPFMGFAAGDDDYCAATDARPEFQLGLLDRQTGRLLAVGNSAPVPDFGDPSGLPETGWDWQAAEARRVVEGQAPAAWLGAFSISVMPTARGRGIARRMIQAFRQRAAEAGLRGVIAPVRPVLKAAYPLMAMDDFIRWTEADSSPVDPWLRSHQRAGGRIIGPCLRSMTVVAPTARWEAWTGLRLPPSGRHAVPGCLAPLEIDTQAGVARYEEPNVWVVHTVG